MTVTTSGPTIETARPVGLGGAAGETAGTHRSAHPIRVRDFRLLFLGEAISLVGDALALVALPWLVLAVTGDAFALGTVLALMGIPRAAFMLIGGAIVDRLSPRLVMLVSNALRMVLVGGLAVTALTGTTAPWMLVAFALLFGIADALFMPAQSAVLPRLLAAEQLPAGNALVAGVAQLAMIVGPVLAGLLIASGGAIVGADPMTGAGLVLVVDALSFLASLATLALMRPQSTARGGLGVRTVLGAVGEGLRHAWGRPALRTLLLLIVAVQAVIVGPFTVGLPVLLQARLGSGPDGYGLVMSAFGAGALTGMLLAGALPRPADRRFGPVVLSVASLSGFGLVAIALAPGLAAVAAIAVIVGAANGWAGITLTAWLQPRIPAALVGRVMSLVMFAFVAVVPVSTPVAGLLVAADPTLALAAAGIAMIVIVAVALTRPSVRALGFEPLAADETTDQTA